MRLSQSQFMHFMRWLAAFFVVISHLRSLVFLDFGQLRNPNLITRFFYFFTSLGHESVIIFFVLSGYLIGNSVISQSVLQRFNLFKYLASRLSRLYSVLIAALIITVVVDNVGILTDKVGLYNNSLKIAAIDFPIVKRLSIGHFLTSMFMLQDIILPPVGSNGPLWSLNYEFWYYLLFPSLFIPSFHWSKKILKKRDIYYILGAILIVAILPSVFLQYFAVWLIGLVAIYVNFNNNWVKYLFGIVFLAAIVISSRNYVTLSGYETDLILSIIFCLWLCSFRKFEQRTNSLTRINEKLASFSYSLYLIHLPVSVLIISLIYNLTGTGLKMALGASGFLIFTILIGLAYLVSYGVALITEFRTSIIRDWMLRIFKYQVLHN